MRTRRKKARRLPSVRRSAIVAVVVVALICAVGWASLGPSALASRRWMEYAMVVVKDERSSPPRAARVYAYVATAYADALDATGNQYSANEAVRLVMAELMPHRTAQTDAFFESLVGDERRIVEQGALDVAYRLVMRMHEDGSDISWQGDAPTDPNLWSDDTDPADPAAGQWKPWIVNVKLDVPPPPEPGSIVHVAEARLVRRAVETRTDTQLAAAYFWAGAAGTVTPAGLWLEELYRYQPRLSDEDFAHAQRALAQAMADSLVYAWRAKYSHWTKRPSQVDPSIETAIEPPAYPGYVSELSAVSSAASVVLSTLFPDLEKRWEHEAAEARVSRLWAGIQFPHDDRSGTELGRRVGEAAVKRLRLGEL